MPNTQYVPLPGWMAVPDSAVVATTRRAPTATRLAGAATTPREKTLASSAKDRLIPVAYGEVSVTGELLTPPITNGSGNLVFAARWCLGEIESIDDVYLNDAVLDPSITVTNYTGTTTQGVDPTLAAAIPAYADTNIVSDSGVEYGIAYSVFEIPAGVLVNGALKVKATIRGRKVYDPRTGITAYSDNPSLCMADIVRLGLSGSPVTGLTEAANWNDELLGGVTERAKLSILISKGDSVDSHLNIMSAYAECFYSYEGEGVNMTPDRIVNLNEVETIDSSKIIDGTVSISRKSSINTPTEVGVRYVELSGGASPSESKTVVQSLPGVDTGEVTRIPTTLSMEGVYREAEALNKALAKLNRLQDQVDISWTHDDSGIVKQKGDVVKINIPNRGINEIAVRILDINMQSYGRYQVSAEKYSAEFYPSEIDPGDDGLVPVGAIALLSGDVVPSDWALFTDADGYFIKAASEVSNPIGSTGGATTIPGFSVGSSSSGGHLGSSTYKWINYSSSGGSYIDYWFGGQPSQPSHAHSVTIPEVTPNLYRRENRLVIKTTSAGLKIPKEIMTFGLDNIIDADATRVTGFADRLLKSSATDSNTGVISDSVSATFSVVDDNHSHGRNYNSGLSASFDFGQNTVFQPREAGGNHSHTMTAAISYALKKYPLALYSGINDYNVRPGRMFLWSGDISKPPTDYVVVESIKDHFIEIAGSTTNAPSGDNTADISGNSSSVGHTHNGSSRTTNLTVRDIYHDNNQTHSHTISQSVSYEPEYYCLAVIMYQPAN